MIGDLLHASDVLRRRENVDVTFRDYDTSVIKFGRNDTVGTTAETVWVTGGLEALPTSKHVDGVWRDRYQMSVRASGTSQTQVEFAAPFLIAPNTDIRVTATSSTGTQLVMASVQGWFGLVIG